MTTSNVSEQTCYGNGGHKASDDLSGGGDISLGIEHDVRGIPSLWDAASPTPPAQHFMTKPTEGASLSEKLFGRRAVEFIACGGPCVSNNALDRAFAGC